MLVDIETPEGLAYCDECLGYTKKPKIFIRFVFNVSGNSFSSVTLDNSDIKSFDYSETVCNSNNYTIGNVSVPSFKFTFFDTPYMFGLNQNIRPPQSPEDTSYWNQNWIEVYYTPFDYNISKATINAFAPGYDPSDPKIVRLGVFYNTKLEYDYYRKIYTITATNRVGLKIDRPFDPSGILFPNTVTAFLVAACTQAGLTCDNSISGLNMEQIMVPANTDLSGHTCRDILQMCASCAGANIVHVNNYRTNSDATEYAYDCHVALLYPGRFKASDVYSPTPNTKSIGKSVYNATLLQVYKSSMFKATDPGENAEIGYVAYGDVVKSISLQPGVEYTRLNIPQNLFMDLLTTAQLDAALGRILSAYDSFYYLPIDVQMTACPTIEIMDAVAFEDRQSDPDFQVFDVCIITSISFNSLSSEKLTSPQNKLALNNSANTAFANVTKASLNASLNNIMKYIKVGNNALGIGTDAPTTGIPANGRADFGMDAHFNNQMYLGNDNLSILTPRYSESSQQISAAGWYRICKISFASASQSNGADGIYIDVIVASSYNHTNNNIHKVSLIGSYLYISFVNETSRNYSTDTITKVRYTTDGNGNGYIDLYYSVNVGNRVNATVQMNSLKGITGFESLGISPVASSPSGEAVQAEYTFIANSSSINQTGTITPASGVTLNDTRCVRRGQTVEVKFYATLSTAPAIDTAVQIATISGVTLPPTNVRWLAGQGVTAYQAYYGAYAILDTSGVITIRGSASSRPVFDIDVTYTVDS